MIKVKVNENAARLTPGFYRDANGVVFLVVDGSPCQYGADGMKMIFSYVASARHAEIAFEGKIAEVNTDDLKAGATFLYRDELYFHVRENGRFHYVNLSDFKVEELGENLQVIPVEVTVHFGKP